MEKLTHDIPKSPGVYHFLDEKGAVLYVGKAKNLKNRIRQYFLKELNRGLGIEQMMGLASDIKWIETDSEIEAVLLEAELINKLQPKYNIRSKDDKSFLVIKITKKIPKSEIRNPKQIKNPNTRNNEVMRQCNNEIMFPCVELVRFKNIDLKDKSAEYFGPYPAGLLLKKSMRYLRKIFPFRDCSKTKFNTYNKKNRPCVFGDIRICTAPCNQWVDEAQYAKNISYLKSFLKGRKKKVIADLEKEMRTKSGAKQFEEAALVRNQLRALGHLKDVAIGLRDDAFDSSHLLFKRIECYDISNIGEKYAVGSMVVLANGKPDKDGYRRFRIKNTELRIKELNNDLGRLKQVLERRFKNDWPLPDLIIIDGGELQLRVAREVLKHFELNIPVISIAKGVQRKKNDFHFSDQNIARYFAKDKFLQNIAITARDEAHRFAINYYRGLHRKNMINNA